MKLSQLNYVLSLSKCGSFSKAAKELYITQPTLSQQIMMLEEELKVKLFIRNARGVRLTDAGEEFVTYAKRIINEVNSLSDSMKSYSSFAKGKVKIGALWVFANIGVAALIAEFQAQNPEIEVNTEINGSIKLIEMLYNREVDAIVYISSDSNLNNNELHTIKLYESDIVLVLPANHKLAKKEQIRFPDLGSEKIILPDEGSSLYKPIMGYLHTYNITPIVVARCSNTDVTMACAENGMGIAFVSADIAKSRQNDKIVIRPLLPSIKVAAHYAVLKDTLVIPSVKRLTTFFEKQEIK